MAFRFPGAPKQQFFTDDGQVLAGGYLWFYTTGTSALLDTYTDPSLSATNTNPVRLDASGTYPGDIWMDGVYRVKLTDSAGAQEWVVDNVQGSGDLPALAGNAGEFLTTDGEVLFFAPVSQVPSVTGQSGKTLTNNGVTAYWDVAASALPSQTGNSGKYLTTNGATASWAGIPIPTGVAAVAYVQADYGAGTPLTSDVISATLVFTPPSKTGTNHIEFTLSANVGGSSSDSNRAYTAIIERYNGSTWDIVRTFPSYFSVGAVAPAGGTWVDAITAANPGVAKNYRARVTATDHPDRAAVFFLGLYAKVYD